MSETVKTVLLVAAVVCALEVVKHIFGVGAALAVAAAVLSFCLGVFWGAGKEMQRKDPAP